MVKMERVSKVYGHNIVVNNISLTVQKGEIMVLVGPSGCGKTTSLKMINRLIENDTGKISIEGVDIKTINPVDLRRKIGYVIQQIGMLPHLTIRDNIAFVLKLLDYPKAKQYARAAELMELVGLPADFLGKRPRQLSGGQQQRVGVARALAADPDLILMDEPFGAVDPLARQQLQDSLLLLQQKVNKTIIFVTHDLQEALKLGSRIALMRNGEIVKIGSSVDLLSDEDEFTRNFFGSTIFFDYLKTITVRQVMGNSVAVQKVSQPVVTEGLSDAFVAVDATGKYLGIAKIPVNKDKINLEDLCQLIPIEASSSMFYAVEKMLRDGCTWLPVVEKDKYLGSLSFASCYKACLALPKGGSENIG